MKRRTLLGSALAGTVGLAAPRIARAAGSVLKFIPQADLAVLDPVFTTADVTRNHAHAVFDTLYSQDKTYAAQPQMVAGHTVDADKKIWELTLRPGLKFHDGTQVLARDCVASINRWGRRDSFGSVLMAATDELAAPSDTVIRFRLKHPFALLPDALAVQTNMCCIMPERLAMTDPMKQVTEMVGSGPFRYVAAERVPGSRVVYQKFDGYRPRESGTPSFLAGPKVAHFDRVEWVVSPEPATNAAALQSKELDWWENPTIDLVPLLKRSHDITVVVNDHTGEIGCLRFNSLYPPFDNAAIRRVVLQATNQKAFMEAVAGAAPELIKGAVGVFAPGSPMASTAGLEVMEGDADPEKLKKALADAGYKGERVVILAASDYPTINAEAQVGADMLRRIGMNIDYQSLDWGTVVQRRASREPPDKGGWNIFFTFLGGTGNISPASSLGIRATGTSAWFGWPTSPKLEALRQAWFEAPDLAAQQKICRDLQLQFFQDVPYVPTGMYDQPTAFQSSLKDVPDGFPLFFGVRRI